MRIIYLIYIVIIALLTNTLVSKYKRRRKSISMNRLNRFIKEFKSKNMPGYFSLSSSFYQKHFDTNKYTKSLITDLLYNADTKFSDRGLVKDLQIGLFYSTYFHYHQCFQLL